MSVVSTAAMDEATAAHERESAPRVGRRQVIAIVAIGYLAAAGAVAATLLVPGT